MILRMTVLPRQARDKQRENSKKRGVSLGIVDWSGFTLLEIAKAAGSATLGHRYMEALAYFRTGIKGQIPGSI